MGRRERDPIERLRSALLRDGRFTPEEVDAIDREVDEEVQAAFVHGMDGMLWECAAIAVAGTVLALVFLPGRAAATATPPPEPARVGG